MSNLMKINGNQLPRQLVYRTQKAFQYFIVIFMIWFAVRQANGQVMLSASFDSFANGFSTNKLIDGGITFLNLDTRAFGGDVFTIQSTTANLPGFSHPNYLSFDSYVSSSDGGAYGFTRFGSTDIRFAGSGLSASVGVLGNVWSLSLPFNFNTSNTLTLQALQGGNVVSTDSMRFTGLTSVIYNTLNVSGIFDSLRLVATGGADRGVVFMGIDNVQIVIVPEPGGSQLLWCGLAVVSFAWYRSRRKSLLKL